MFETYVEHLRNIFMQVKLVLKTAFPNLQYKRFSMYAQQCVKCLPVEK